MAYKGIYKPTHPKKYAGDPNKIVYRSNWERRFMVYCDKNDDIIYWKPLNMNSNYRFQSMNPDNAYIKFLD